MDNYKLLDFDKEKLVVSCSYEDPLSKETILKISSELRFLEYKGIVKFDTLSSIGDNSDRFCECYFDGKRLLGETFVILGTNSSHVKKKIREKTSDFFRENSSLLDNTVLTAAQKLIISKGLSI